MSDCVQGKEPLRGLLAASHRRSSARGARAYRDAIPGQVTEVAGEAPISFALTLRTTDADELAVGRPTDAPRRASCPLSCDGARRADQRSVMSCPVRAAVRAEPRLRAIPRPDCHRGANERRKASRSIRYFGQTSPTLRGGIGQSLSMLSKAGELVVRKRLHWLVDVDCANEVTVGSHSSEHRVGHPLRAEQVWRVAEG